MNLYLFDLVLNLELYFSFMQYIWRHFRFQGLVGVWFLSVIFKDTRYVICRPLHSYFLVLIKTVRHCFNFSITSDQIALIHNAKLNVCSIYDFFLFSLGIKWPSSFLLSCGRKIVSDIKAQRFLMPSFGGFCDRDTK